MYIAITGASGFLGRYVVEYFAAQGARLLLVGRDLTKLQEQFPGFAYTSYAQLQDAAQGVDAVVHLAVLNNNVAASGAEFTRVNVEMALEIANAARAAGVPRFVNVSTVHALTPGASSPYAKSKKLAAERIDAVAGMDVRTLYFPALLGDQTSGGLGLLNRLGVRKGGFLARAYAALTPVIDVEEAVAACWQAATDPTAPRHCIVVRDQGQNPVYGAVRRLMDVGASLAIVLFFFWFLALIWLAVRLTSPGPGIFAQQRVGRDGKVFTCYKFRTMSVGAPNVGTHEASASLVTPIGHFLRRTKIDELPQLMNMLRNEMSLIGPRPCLPNQVDVVGERQKRQVLSILPGITGLAQVNNVDMSEPEVLAQWDSRYVKLRSLKLDLAILIATLRGRGGGDLIRVQDEGPSADERADVERHQR